MKDPEDVAVYKKVMERLMVHIFLAGLDTHFDQVCEEILRKDPVPTLEKCYAFVRRGEVRRSSLTKNKYDNVAALVSRNRFNKTPNTSFDKSTKCEHYNKVGHDKSLCYEIVGYPKW